MDRDAKRVVSVLLVLVQLKHAGLVVAAAGEEVADRFASTGNLDALRVAVSVAQWRDLRVLDRAEDADAVVALGAIALGACAERHGDQGATRTGNGQHLAGRGVKAGQRVVVRVPVSGVEHTGFRVGRVSRRSAT